MLCCCCITHVLLSVLPQLSCLWQRYKADGYDTIVLAGEEYGSGSSRDWAAKGPMLLVFDNIVSLPFLCWLPEICNIYLTKLMPSGGESGDRQEFREDPSQQPSGNGGDTPVLQAW